MATLYVDPESGNDLTPKASNNAAAPWRRLRRAILDAAANDTIVVNTSGAADAVRGQITVNKDVTIKAANDYWHCSASYPAEEGKYYEYLDSEDYCQSYTTQTPSGFAGYTGTPSIDAAGHLIGAGCLLLNVAGVRKSFAYTNNKPKRYRIIYKCDAGDTLNLRIRGVSDTFNFNCTTGQWVSGAFINPLTATEWTEYVTPWIDGRDDAGNFVLLYTDTGNIARVQLIMEEFQAKWLDDTNGTKSWWFTKPAGTGEFQVNYAAIGPHAQCPFLFKCSTTDYASQGVAALRLVPTKSSAANLTGGDAFYDDTLKKLYYKPASGETFSDLHLELSLGGKALHITSACKVIRPYAFANQTGIFGDTTGTVHLDKAVEWLSTFTGMEVRNTGTYNLYQPRSVQPLNPLTFANKYQGGGFLVGQTGSANRAIMNIYGVYCENAGDDSYQPIGNGTINVYGGVSINPNAQDVEMNNGTANSGSVFYNVSGNSVRGFRDQSPVATTVTLRNCAFPSFWYETINARNYTIGTDNYCSDSVVRGTGTKPAQDSNVNYNANLAFTSSTDLTPISTSDLVGGGSRWWHPGVNPTGGDGNPFSDIGTDAGGIQSKHHPLHPSNI